MNPYDITLGPEGDLPPSVSERGAVGPSKGERLVMGEGLPEQQAIDDGGAAASQTYGQCPQPSNW